jgi:hypothetical protein
MLTAYFNLKNCILPIVCSWVSHACQHKQHFSRLNVIYPIVLVTVTEFLCMNLTNFLFRRVLCTILIKIFLPCVYWQTSVGTFCSNKVISKYLHRLYNELFLKIMICPLQLTCMFYVFGQGAGIFESV